MDKDQSSARDEILGRIRNSTRTEKNKSNIEDAQTSMKTMESATINFAAGPDKFIAKLNEVKATVSVISSRMELVREVHEYVARHQEKPTITLANEPELTSLDWSESSITTDYEPHSISVSVTSACYGIEETGTLILYSSPTSPTGMNFLPDYHIVTLDTSNIVVSMDDVWCGLRKNEQAIPRSINMITGPSKTADIEQDIQFGAHGPKFLHVILIQNT